MYLKKLNRGNLLVILSNKQNGKEIKFKSRTVLHEIQR